MHVVNRSVQKIDFVWLEKKKLILFFSFLSVVFRAAVPLVARCHPSKVWVAQVPLLDQPWNLEFTPFSLGFTVGCPGTRPPYSSPNTGRWTGKIWKHIISHFSEIILNFWNWHPSDKRLTLRRSQQTQHNYFCARLLTLSVINEGFLIWIWNVLPS